MSSKQGILRTAAKGVGVLAVFFLSFTIAFYILQLAYELLHWQPHELLAQFINALLGVVLFAIFIALVELLIPYRKYHPMGDLIDALRRISRGDYHVHLDWGDAGKHSRKKPHNPFVQLVDSINDMAANLKLMEELRQEFISNISHEIGSPLASIRGFARALQDDELPPEKRQRYLSIIETECQRLARLSDHLLKLAMLDSDRQPFHPRSYRLDKQLVALILACEPQWEEKKMEMELDLEPVEGYADEDLISQVWVNLIHNAIKFTPEGGKIHISLKQQHDQAVVRIADTGPGISDEDQKRIFERFYMVDKSRNRSAGGSGLGLAITHKIVELHRGSISVHSNLGEGAVFTVSLPLRASK